jgi:hypothetical protein
MDESLSIASHLASVTERTRYRSIRPNAVRGGVADAEGVRDLPNILRRVAALSCPHGEIAPHA